MAKKMFVAVAVALLALAAPLAAEDPDTQFRTPFHVQGKGWAAWAIVPDWTVPDPNLLAVAGPLWKHSDGDMKQWVELLGGVMRQGKSEELDPVMNIRALRSTLHWEAYAEALHNFGNDRTAVAAYVTFPTPWKLRAGVEAEASFGKGKPDLAAGPRLALPFKCGPAKCAIVASYLWRTGKDGAIRGYSPVNF